MNSWPKLVAALFLLFAFGPVRIHPQEQFKLKELLQKDLNAYAGNELLLSVGEVTLAPGATGTQHRHPGPTFVYVLDGAVEIELEGAPAKTYYTGDSFYEEPRQLHIATRNPSRTDTARILVYHLSHKGEPLTTPEK